MCKGRQSLFQLSHWTSWVLNCTWKFRCPVCHKKHHTLLHNDEIDQQQQPVTSCTSMENKTTESSTTSMATSATNLYPINEQLSQSILSTALFYVTNQTGQRFICRALLDSGSMSSFITEKCCQRLNLSRRNCRKIVNGVGNVEAGTTREITTLFITSMTSNESYLEVDAHILSRITSNLPEFSINRSDLSHFKNLQLADPFFNVSCEIDILIEHFFQILKSKRIQGSNNQPTAQETIFGWIIGGKWESSPKSLTTLTTQTIQHSSAEVNIDKILRTFWEIEELVQPVHLTEDEKLCESHFQQNYKRQNGRFVLKLPLKNEIEKLGSSLPLAINCLKSTERKLMKDELYRHQNVKFMAEYEQLGHMRKLSEDEVKKFGYYIPHHGIMSIIGEKVKFRVVFNASAKTSTGVSLNDQLLCGPPVQSFIYSIMVRYRQHKYVFSCDIEKMYRQFLIHPDDSHLQRIVWRNSPDEPIKHYELVTVTYGTASVPFLATRALNQLAMDNMNLYKDAAQSLLEDVYVDDIMTGTNSIESIMALKSNIITILDEAGMKLAKWVSNCSEIIEDVNQEQSVKEINVQDAVSVLGIKWSPARDVFIFKINLPESTTITKRSILSEASRTFDPIGWLAPIIVRIKIFYQQLWLIPVSWDDELPLDIQNEWRIMRAELKQIERISIPRWYQTESDSIELHGFGDASELAYGAVVYIRSSVDENLWHCNLVSAKTKVAPIKKLSIPRLELCAAVLTVELMNQVKNALKFNHIKMFYWSDSTTVLGWLSSHPSRWSTFIANRTSQILQMSHRDHWFHVTSKNNPADLASRGSSPLQLATNQLWWSGPEFLTSPERDWPKQRYHSTLVEAKEKVNVLVVYNTTSFIGDLLEKHSTLYRINKVVAIMMRFINNCRVHHSKHLKRKGGLIDKEDMSNALILIIKHSHHEQFQAEISHLQQHQDVSNNSQIQNLKPFMDDQGILRVGGRLQNALIPYDTKHPIILSPKSKITYLLAEDYHQKFFHASSNLLTNLLRHKYWIIRCKDVVKNVNKKCLKCFRLKPQPEEQQMGNLPDARVEFIRPFLKVGCDFCGPFMVYHKRGRGQKPAKHYICLFVCMSTKAIHLELVSSLTTEAFLAAFRRLVCRRGPCSDVYSDCGTNFVGANNYLKEVILFLKLHHDDIHNQLLRDNITWHFNPPASPHQGGLWESMIKSVKTHLKRTTGNHILTAEEMTTLLCEIENVINSRPLCVLSNDNLEALTPAHFLFHHAATYICA